MKFKNVSDRIKMFKKDGVWNEVPPGVEVELEGRVDMLEPGLELVCPEVVLEEKPEILLPEVKPEVVPVKPLFKSEKELKAMDKDALNDYAAIMGLGEVNTKMWKSTMIKKILKFQDENK